MIDHVALYVSDVDRNRRFYERALAGLGYAVEIEREGFVGFAHGGSLQFVLRSGSGLDERGKPGDVIGLHVGLEDGPDRRAEAIGLLEVVVHKVDMGIDDRELAVREAAEQVTRASRGSEEERPEDHPWHTGTTRPSIGQGESFDTAHRCDRYIALTPLGHDAPSPAR